ncbi:MAG: hypothetical protein HRU77_01560 [Gammaproteobacteria bacterium]|nr:MAG: hypothetical protein HRU77_01560 [Gammaproteobacteria bacterium]
MSTEFDINNVSDDPEEWMKAFNQLEAGEALPPDADKEQKQETKTEETQESKSDANDSVKQDNDKKPDNDQVGEQNNEPDGVATKDGKHVIPYSVLKSERDKAARAEQLLKETQQKLADLEAKQQANASGTNTGENVRADDQNQATEDLSAEDLEALKEDFPTVYKAYQAAMAKTAQLEAKLNPVEQSVKEMEEVSQRTTKQDVQDAIDAVPKIAHIQATDAEAFELAQQFDKTLRNQPFWEDKPLTERFNKVAEMVENALGRTIEVPGSNKTNSMSAEQMAKAARDKAASMAAASKSNVPTSLSEFPAGTHAAADERSALENMTTLQLAEKFAGMSAEQMDEYLQSL